MRFSRLHDSPPRVTWRILPLLVLSLLFWAAIISICVGLLFLLSSFKLLPLVRTILTIAIIMFLAIGLSDLFGGFLAVWYLNRWASKLTPEDLQARPNLRWFFCVRGGTRALVDESSSEVTDKLRS